MEQTLQTRAAVLPPVQDKQNINDEIYYLSQLRSGRIKDLNQEAAYETIGRVLDLIIKMLGIRNAPDPELSAKIIRFFRFNYGALFPGEIEFAFDLALMDRLEVNLEHFNSFDLKYINAVMKAYVKYKGVVIKNKQAESKALGAGGENEAEKIQRAQADTIRRIAEIYAVFITSGAPLAPGNFYWPFMYDFLEKIGLIELTPKEKQEYFAKAGQVHREKMAQNSIGNLVNKLLNRDTTPTAEQRRIAKELALNAIFKAWGEAQTNVSELMLGKMTWGDKNV